MLKREKDCKAACARFWAVAVFSGIDLSFDTPTIISTIMSTQKADRIKIINWAKFYPPASEASREVANFVERKNPHMVSKNLSRIWCQRIFLSVCY